MTQLQPKKTIRPELAQVFNDRLEPDIRVDKMLQKVHAKELQAIKKVKE